MALFNLFKKSPSVPIKTLHLFQKFTDLIGAEHDIEEIPELIIPLLVDLFDPDIACCYVRDPRTRNYCRTASFPSFFWQQKEVQRKFDRISQEIQVIERTVTSREAIGIHEPFDLGLESGYVSFDSRIKTQIVVPIVAEYMVAEENVVALVILSRFTRKRFATEELQLMKTIEAVLSVAYNKCFAKQRRIKRLEFLRAASELDTTDLDSAFQNYLQALSNLMPMRYTSLWLYNELDDTLVVRSFYPSVIGQKKMSFESYDARVLYCSESSTGEVLKLKRPKIVSNLDPSDKFCNPQFAKKYGLRWFVCFPILDPENKPLGVVNLWPYGDVKDFGPETMRVMATYISPIANVVRLLMLRNIESLLFSYDHIFQNMIDFADQSLQWDKLASQVRDQMKCEACSIFLLGLDGVLRLAGTTGIEGNPRYNEVWYSVHPEPQGLTGTAFCQKDPLVYYAELRSVYAKDHISKHREILRSPGKSKSIIFVRICDNKNNPIGVIRCNNKEEIPGRQVGRFTKEDILLLHWIARIISNIHAKVEWLKGKEVERERSLNALHHEILSPIDAVLAHIEWWEQYVRPANLPDWVQERMHLKFNDVKQSGKLLEMIVTTIGQVDQENIQLTDDDFSVPDLLEICKGFIINEARRKKITVSVDYLGLPRIRGDALYFMRVFFNLFRNAIKYSDYKEEGKFIRIYASQEKDNFILFFGDNGIGIVEGEEELIFEKFKRGSNASKVFPEGTGLGLAYCKSIMSKHGGSISVASLAKPTILQIKIPRDMVAL